MKICILCAVIIVLLTNDARADEQSNQNILIKKSTSESPNFPHFSSYDKITEDDHPENQGHIRFENQSLERPVKFDDYPKHGYIDINKADPGLHLADITFDDDESFDQNNRISNTGSGYEGESNHSENKIKFEGDTDAQENLDYQGGNDEEDHPQSGASQVVFEDDGKADEYKFDYSDESEIKAETIDKPIKFENQNNESSSNHRDADRNPVTKRVVFKDDSDQNQQPVQKKKREPKRKPHYEAKQTNPAPRPQNSPYPGSGYPGYPGVGYPSSGYPGPGDPNTGYSGYPTPGYTAPGYPYPNYSSPYQSMAFTTPAYPGHSPYPSIYAPMSPGYGVYTTPGYQISGDHRPSASPTAYPSPGQGDPNLHTDTRYPSQEHAVSPAPGVPPSSAPQSDQPGPQYLGPEYPHYYGYPVPGYPPPYPSDANSQYPTQNQAQYRPSVYPGVYQQGYQPQGPQRPSRRPKSLTERAVSAVAEALTSIALYDDQQCVPRILCEMAGGSTASSPTLLKASASLQPLLSLLQAYNGVSSSPLFIFGRAAVMGVTAKGNPSACYRAYPQCPRDPEKLINYLNNHNGGFFRFFGQPETPQQPHNLEQFYSYLSGQNGLPQQPQQQSYGNPRPYGYGFPLQKHYAHPYNHGHNYYNEQNRYRNTKDISDVVDSEVEGRIQNKPGINVLEADSDLTSSESQDEGSKWSFPKEGSTKKGKERDRVKITEQSKRPPQAERQERPSRGSKTLIFPDNRSDDRREIQMIRDYPRKEKEKHIFFPGESPDQINTIYQTTTPVNPEEYYFDHKHNFYVKRPKALKTDDVVYVLRGNGDPNHPEIVKVRPGQSI